MTENPSPVLDTVLSGLMRRYQARVPDVESIISTMMQHGIVKSPTDIENDHVAFRTMGVSFLGIASLEKIFLHYEYQKRDRFKFTEKKLNACWYSPPFEHYPRIFISKLRVHDLSPSTQRIIHKYTDVVTADPVDTLTLDDGHAVDAFLHQSLWQLPTWNDFQTLAAESEYAAWVIYNRYYLNHFTISVHNLPKPYCAIAHFNNFLEENGFKLNDSGGKIKTSADGKLAQSSTVAEFVPSPFDNGLGGTVTKLISGSYVEFAERRVLDEFATLPAEKITGMHRRDGFETANANRIFESTFNEQTKKRSD